MSRISKLELGEVYTEEDLKLVRGMFSALSQSSNIIAIFERLESGSLQNVLVDKRFLNLIFKDASITISHYQDMTELMSDFSKIVSFHVAPVYFVILENDLDLFERDAQNFKYFDWLSYILKNHKVITFDEYILEANEVSLK
jgi:hypothetical protein